MTEQELINKLEESGNCTLYLMKVGMFFMPTMPECLRWYG